jgi:hypothetical protein
LKLTAPVRRWIKFTLNPFGKPATIVINRIGSGQKRTWLTVRLHQANMILILQDQKMVIETILFPLVATRAEVRKKP